jgi:WD40 repeat protein
MSSTHRQETEKQPYPGLRAYTQDEASIYFGRAEQINRMLARLEDGRFLAVVGSSGSGKSSLVRAGLLPALEDGYLLMSGNSECSGQDWLFVSIKPGKDPYMELAREWVDQISKVNHSSFERKDSDIGFSQAVLESSSEGFINLVNESQLDSKYSILLLVDQFEEIFRFQSDASRDSSPTEPSAKTERNNAKAFVNLLLTTLKRSSVDGREKNPIYVVITMRSDFIGNCERFVDLPQAVSDSQFLVPLMTRDQMREAIEKPLSSIGWKAEPDLVNQILNDSASSTDQLCRASADQLPLMQHALMRTWFAAKERLHNDGEKIITLQDYQKIGGINTALSQHLMEAYASLQEPAQHTDASPAPSQRQIVAESLFMSLCERNNEGQLVRRPVSLGDAAQVAGVDSKTIFEVVEAFQRDQRNFILTTPPGDQSDKAMLDISHEALLRQWESISDWVDRESKSAEIYRRLYRSSQLRQKDPGHVLMGLELTEAEAWEKELPTKTDAWGKRYIRNDLGNELIDFAQVLAFIHISQEARERRREEEEKERKEKEIRLTQERDWQRRQKHLSVLGVIFVSALAGWGFRQSYIGTVNQVRLFLFNAQSSANKDPVRAISYTLAALEIQPRFPFPSPKISTIVRDILSTAIASPRQISFPKGRQSFPQLPDTQAGPIWSVIVPDKDRVISGAANGSVSVWNQRDGKQLASIEGLGRSQILNLIQLGNGDLISGEVNGRLRRWVLNNSGKIEQKWESKPEESSEPIISLINLTDNEFVTGDSGGGIRWWRRRDDGLAFQLVDKKNSGQISVNSLARLANNEFYSAGQDGSIRHWKNRAEIHRFNTGDPIRSLIHHSDGVVITANVFSQIRKWDLQKNRPLSELIPTSQGSVRSMIRLGADKFLTAGTDGTFVLWQNNMRVLSQPMESGQGIILGLAASDQGSTLYTGGSDGSIRRWDLSHVDGEFKTTITNSRHDFSKSLLLHSDLLLTGDQQGTLQWWGGCDAVCNLDNAVLVRSIPTNQGKIIAMAELPSSKNLITAAANGTLALWSSEGKEIIAPFRSDEGFVHFILPLSNQVIAITQDDSKVVRLQTWSANLQIRKTLRSLPKSPTSALVLRSGEIVLGGLGEVTIVSADGRDAKTISTVGQRCRIKKDQNSPLQSLLELKNGGGLLAGAADGCLLHIQMQGGGSPKIVGSYLLSASGLTGMVENDNSELLISNDKGRIYILDRDTLDTLVAENKTGLGSITFLTVNGKGELIAGWQESNKLIVRRWRNQNGLLENACEMLGQEAPQANSPGTWSQSLLKRLRSLTSRFNSHEGSPKSNTFPAASDASPSTINDAPRKEQKNVDNLALKFCLGRRTR